MKNEIILEILYDHISSYDDVSEKLISLCVKLNALEKERETYSKMNMNEIFNGTINSVIEEEEKLLNQKYELECQLANYDMEEIMRRVGELELEIYGKRHYLA